MSNRLNNLFSPERLNARWDNSDSLNDTAEETVQPTADSVHETIENKYVTVPDIPGSWERCRLLFHDHFENAPGVSELIDGINKQLQKIFLEEEGISQEEKAALLADLTLFERLAEVQIITKHNTLAIRHGN